MPEGFTSLQEVGSFTYGRESSDSGQVSGWLSNTEIVNESIFQEATASEDRSEQRRRKWERALFVRTQNLSVRPSKGCIENVTYSSCDQVQNAST